SSEAERGGPLTPRVPTRRLRTPAAMVAQDGLEVEQPVVVQEHGQARRTALRQVAMGDGGTDLAPPKLQTHRKGRGGGGNVWREARQQTTASPAIPGRWFCGEYTPHCNLRPPQRPESHSGAPSQCRLPARSRIPIIHTCP